ncbi:aminotransferase-like domain-containing protein [Enterococcus dispar]|uniref:aminotransferase-like domain-containing protein n=1 Tax=Enterococcus dispar TaxID=44009 RepID=UPI00232E4D71|nr:PLP-dependent aminotransferase family protein [Enterococcus dispar]WCG32347.1 PLP-dependent aminotransferase family protein [Enterococcus dispar]
MALNRKSKIPLFQQLMEVIIADIESGKLAPGDRLMPERKMAEFYQVNRSTVNHALEELTSLGWLIRKQGSGTEVAKGRWGSRQAPQFQWQHLLATRSQQQDPYLKEQNRLRKSFDTIDLASGDLPPDLIPDFQFPALSWDTIIKEEKNLTDTGYIPLKNTIIKKLEQNFQLPLANQDLLITAGSTQGISLILQTLLQPGDVIATEDPSFLFALPLFQSLGLRLEGIPTDQEGIMPSELEKQILTKKVKILYLNPTFQNPTSRCLSYERRLKIIEICRKYYVPIIEDDVFGELAFTAPIPKLKEIAPEQVLYLGSLSKIFGPNIKIGWLLAPKNLIRSLANTKKLLDSETNLFTQILANFALNNANYDLQHTQLLNTLKKRSHLLCETFAPFQKDWYFTEIKGGLYYWFTWQHQNLSRKDWQLFFPENLLVAPSFLFSNDTMSMRINYTSLTPTSATALAKKIREITLLLLKRAEV